MLTKEDMLKYLTMLGEKLDSLGVKGEIILAGGASMCLAHEPRKIISKLVTEIAIAENLPVNWMNDAVEVFMGSNVETEFFLSLKGLTVHTVTAEYLLAMKIRSARLQEHDLEDACILVEKLHISEERQLCCILCEYLPFKEISTDIGQVIKEISARMFDPGNRPQGRPKP